MSDKLTDLLTELEQANTALKDAALAETAARSVCTSARNKVNRLQKAIDEQMDKLKCGAEWDTDWHSALRRATGVTVSQ